MTVVILVLLVGLAAANGANDVSKGVATLAGAGVTAYRTAILWGTATTLLGALLSIQLGRSMGKLFSSGIVSATPTAAFALAVLVGTASWVTLASIARLPVSTTHAIVGSLVGAGLMLAPDSIRWPGVAQKVVLPLLLSIVVAYTISMILATISHGVRRHRARRQPQDAPVPALVGAGDGANALTAERAEARPGEAAPVRSIGRKIETALHWFSSGATGCARGLNDTPKIAAIGGFALIPAGYSTTSVALIVGFAMAGGSLLGIRVARTLGDKVVKMSHTEGFLANATTATLVGSGALLALPMSTTHVSTSSIVGSAGTQVSRVSGKMLRDFAIAWTVTPFFGATVAAIVYLIAR